jgi:hypothetical protein
MTAAGYYGDGDSPKITLKERWAQIAGHGWIGFYCFWLASVVTNSYVNGAWGWVITGVLIAGIVAMNWGEFQHSRNLCWRCWKIVPLDPEAKVKKHDRALRAMHWVWNKGFKAFLALMAVFFFPLVFVVVVFPLIGLDTKPWNLFGFVGIFGVQMFLAYTGNRHQWLRPWCPYCKRWDDGGSHEVVPDPVPSGENDRDLVA